MHHGWRDLCDLARKYSGLSTRASIRIEEIDSVIETITKNIIKAWSVHKYCLDIFATDLDGRY